MSTVGGEMVEQEPNDSLADVVRSAMRFVRVLQYRKELLVWSLVVACTLGGVYYFTSTRIFQANASLLILQTGPELWKGAAGTGGQRQDLIPTYERLFSTSVVLEGALQRLQKLPVDMRVDIQGLPRDEWVDVLRDNLSAHGIRNTNVIEIIYRSKSPRAAEAVVSCVVNSYLDFVEQNHKDVSVEIVNILEKERKSVETQLQSKQQQLRQVSHEVRDLGIKENTRVVHPSIQRVIRMNEALLEVQHQRWQLEGLNHSLAMAIAEGGDLRQLLVSIEPVIGRELIMSALGINAESHEAVSLVQRKMLEDRAKLETLLQFYGDNHFEIRQLRLAIQNAEQFIAEHHGSLEQRLDRFPQQQLAPMLTTMVNQKLSAAQAQEAELLIQYQRAEAAAVALNDRMAELAMVENEIARLQGLHDTLLDQIANIDMNQNHANIRVAMVSHPKADPNPVSPKRALVALMCLFAGTTVGAIVIYVVDLLDDRFRSPEEIREQLGLQVLAMVRKLPVLAQHGLDAVQVHVAPNAVESEAFRTLRATLTFSGNAGCVALTSSEPGDGKTTVIANLAVSCVQAGKRVLLVDADLRRPGLSRMFQLRGQLGLADVLRSDQPMATAVKQVLQADRREGLDLVGCGSRVVDPAELLSGPRFTEFIDWAVQHYDQVLVDCPPIVAASDAAIVGRIVNGLILVIQPDKNHRRQVIRSVESVQALQVPFHGTVINAVSAEADGYYGYGTGYGYGYGEGYGYGDVEHDADPAGTVDSEDAQQPQDAEFSLTLPQDSPAADEVPSTNRVTPDLVLKDEDQVAAVEVSGRSQPETARGFAGWHQSHRDGPDTDAEVSFDLVMKIQNVAHDDASSPAKPDSSQAGATEIAKPSAPMDQLAAAWRAAAHDSGSWGQRDVRQEHAEQVGNRRRAA